MPNPIQYFLIPNYLTPDPNDQYARVSPRNILSTKEIIERCLRRGTTLTRTDITAVANLFMEEAIAAVAEGNNVNLPLVNIKASVTGVFKSKSDSFDPARHQKRASLSMGAALVKAMSEAELEKIQEPLPSPCVLEFIDVNSGSSNSILTPGGIGTITGVELKFDPSKPADGLYFVPVVGGEVVKVSVISIRTEGKLSFLIPTGIAQGEYKLEVRRSYTSANTIRTGELPDVLTVVS